jgi:DNA-binding MarR family transcriptional regulator
MSIEALDWAFKLNRSGVTSTMKLVLLVLADFAGDEDEAYPRQTTIAARALLERETVNKNLKKLESIGLNWCHTHHTTWRCSSASRRTLRFASSSPSPAAGRGIACTG